MSERITRKILEQAREQRREEEGGAGGDDGDDGDAAGGAAVSTARARLFRADESDSESVFSEDEAHYLDGTELSPADERVLSLFVNPARTETRTLGDIIAAKLREKESNIALVPAEVEERVGVRLGAKVTKVYGIVATTLRRYRSGKLPKAFKIIPTLENWEDVLYLTHPPNWTPQAMYQATRIFASSLNAEMAQRFFSLVLLPCVREDIAERGKLNYHLYQALRKALYKPGAFYKGFVIPLVEEGSCTMRTAMIVAAVLRKARIPVLHSAAAMVKLCSFAYSGAVTILLSVLIDKKYSLPMRVIDTIVEHFVSFGDVREQMPVIWHQSLLSFCQRYKNDLQDEQKNQLRHLLHAQNHYIISDEIRRELFDVTEGHCPVVLPEPLAMGATAGGPQPLSMTAAPVFATALMDTLAMQE